MNQAVEEAMAHVRPLINNRKIKWGNLVHAGNSGRLQSAEPGLG